MATNRTATNQWRKTRAKVIQQAIDNQQWQCNICTKPLDYNRAQQPDSPEVDHIIPVAKGGTDDIDNLRVICRQCNQRLGAKLGNQRRWAGQAGAGQAGRPGPTGHIGQQPTKHQW